MARGGLISYGALLSGKLLMYVSTLVLARVLIPDDFGVVGYAVAVLGIMNVARDVGTGASLVYRADFGQDDADEVFVVAMLGALSTTLVAWLLAPAIAAYFHEPRAALVIRVLSVSFVLKSLGEVHSAQLQKRLYFGRRALPTLWSGIVRAAVSIALAEAGLRYWSLVWGMLVGDGVFALCCWRLFPWRPRLILRWTSSWRLVRYGLHVVLLGVAALLLLSVDNLVVGRVLGTTALGIYALAFTIIQALTIALSGAISQATFPGLALLQADIASLRRQSLGILRSMSMVLVSIGLGFSGISAAFVHTFFPPVWWPMIPVVRILAVYASIYAIGASTNDVYLATGRPDLQWKLDGLQLMILVPALITAARMGGITGVAVAQLLAVIPYTAARAQLFRRVLNVPVREVTDAVRPSILVGCGVYAVVLVVGWAAEACRPSVMLMWQVGLGLVSYVALALWLDLRIWRNVREWVLQFFQIVAEHPSAHGEV